MAEQGDHRFRQPFPARAQDLSSFSPPTQPRPSALRASDQLSESAQATLGLIKVPQEPRRSEELLPNPAVINQPGIKAKIFSPQGTAWSPVIPPKPELNDHHVDHKGIKKERSPSLSTSDAGEKSVRDMIDIQRQQQPHNEQLMYMQQHRNQQLLGQHQQLSLTLTLPHADMQTFDGDPVNYCNFIRSFIEAKTKSSNTKLYYLVQYTSGDVQELMRSCLSMQPDEGYREVCRLLKERYGQNYKISSAYVTRVTNGPPINHEDGQALRKFSTLFASFKNTLREVGYLKKTENPDSMQRVTERLPLPLRQRWRDVADDITKQQAQRNYIRGHCKLR